MAAAWDPARQVGDCSHPGPIAPPRAVSRMLLPSSAEGDPETRDQRPETRDQRPETKTPDVRCQHTRPLDHPTIGRQDPPASRSPRASPLHLPASPDAPCTLPPGLAQGRGRGGGDEARAALEALRRLHACAARPAAAAGRKVCVRVCVCVPGLTLGGAAACPLESRGSCMRAARESRVAGTLQGGCGELRLATTARSYSWLRAVRCSRGVHAQPAQSRPPNACPYRAIPHRLQAAAAQRGRRRRHRHGHRHVIATGPPSGVAVLCAQRSVLGRGRLGAGEPVRSRQAYK